MPRAAQDGRPADRPACCVVFLADSRVQRADPLNPHHLPFFPPRASVCLLVNPHPSPRPLDLGTSSSSSSSSSSTTARCPPSSAHQPPGHVASGGRQPAAGAGLARDPLDPLDTSGRRRTSSFCTSGSSGWWTSSSAGRRHSSVVLEAVDARRRWCSIISGERRRRRRWRWSGAEPAPTPASVVGGGGGGGSSIHHRRPADGPSPSAASRLVFGCHVDQRGLSAEPSRPAAVVVVSGDSRRVGAEGCRQSAVDEVPSHASDDDGRRRGSSHPDRATTTACRSTVTVWSGSGRRPVFERSSASNTTNILLAAD